MPQVPSLMASLTLDAREWSLRKGRVILGGIFEAFSESYLSQSGLRIMPESFDRIIHLTQDRRTRARVLCDYIAGMTDGFAIRTYTQLFDPGFGSILDLGGLLIRELLASILLTYYSLETQGVFPRTTSTSSVPTVTSPAASSATIIAGTAVPPERTIAATPPTTAAPTRTPRKNFPPVACEVATSPETVGVD